MTDLDWGKIIAVFISCAIKPGIGGIPAAVLAGFSFWEALIICSSGGIFGIVFFSYLIGAIIKWTGILLDKYFPNRGKKKKVFSRKTRFIIRAKRSFGILGISIITPLVLSIPLGIFLALRFFGDRRKIIIWMSAAMIFWTAALYLLYSVFQSSLINLFS